jgi:diguanylate cyclase (GGDEF)-like protein
MAQHRLDITPEWLFEGAFHTLPLSAAIVDASGIILSTNQAWRAFAEENGGDPDGQLGIDYFQVCGQADKHARAITTELREIAAGSRERLETEYPCHSPERRRWFVMRASRIERGGQVFLLICHADITDRRLAEEEAFRLASEDALTGLLNRRSFQERLEHALDQARRQDLRLAVLFLDLNGFKAINDTHGHDAGDRVLRHVAGQLRQALRRADSLSRFGGDEFAMFLEDADTAVAGRVAGRIQEVLADGVVVDGQGLPLNASVGISFFPDHGGDVQSLLRAADAAMYEAKRGGDHVATASDSARAPSA